MDTAPKSNAGAAGAFSSSVTLSTSTSELKLLRVLQTLQALCGDTTDESSSKKNESSVIVTEELVHLFRHMQFDDLWDELSSCLKIVQVLEGVSSGEAQSGLTNDEGSKKRAEPRNFVARQAPRFPSIEASYGQRQCDVQESAKEVNLP
jgi:hypothetical protein